MARGVNKVILIGNVGQDPEVKHAAGSGIAVCAISVATNHTWKDQATGEKREHAEWHRVVFFAELAETVGKYVKKGSKLFVEGYLKTREWEKEGQKHYTTEIMAQQMQMLDSKGSGGGDEAATQARAEEYARRSGGRRPQTGTTAPSSPSDGVPFDDDIPF